jgi:hypothetical protein
MYEKHEDFKSPKNENQRIWRYLDFTKFVSLLDRKELFFVCAQKLEDPYEGLFSDATMKALKKIPNDSPYAIIKDRQKWQLSRKESVYISCWCMNNYESAAMWKLFVNAIEGVALCSTFRRLRDSFRDNGSLKVNIGMVEYMDYDKQTQRIGNILLPFLWKRESFEYEKELRAIICINDEKKREELKESKKLSSDGVYIPIEISTLIEKIFISPKAEGWFKDLVSSVVNKYDCKIEPEQSELTAKPLI